MSKFPLSVVIIARNAEKHLSKCLKSICDIASEIIVVVNDCNDNTIDIAKKFNSKIVEHQWEGFSKQKNFALTQATQKWILSLDSDEVVGEVLKRSIIKFISTNKKFSAARFKRITYFLGKWIKHGDWYPDYSTRLFLNKKATWQNNSVHEKLEVKGKICKISGDLFHYSFESLHDHVIKNIKYADLFIQNKKTSNKEYSPCVAIARSSWKFFRAYVIKLGFLDGFAGYYIAKANAFITLYKYINTTKKADW